MTKHTPSDIDAFQMVHPRGMFPAKTTHPLQFPVTILKTKQHAPPMVMILGGERCWIGGRKRWRGDRGRGRRGGVEDHVPT